MDRNDKSSKPNVSGVAPVQTLVAKALKIVILSGDFYHDAGSMEGL